MRVMFYPKLNNESNPLLEPSRDKGQSFTLKTQRDPKIQTMKGERAYPPTIPFLFYTIIIKIRFEDGVVGRLYRLHHPVITF